MPGWSRHAIDLQSGVPVDRREPVTVDRTHGTRCERTTLAPLRGPRVGPCDQVGLELAGEAGGDTGGRPFSGVQAEESDGETGTTRSDICHEVLGETCRSVHRYGDGNSIRPFEEDLVERIERHVVDIDVVATPTQGTGCRRERSRLVAEFVGRDEEEPHSDEWYVHPRRYRRGMQRRYVDLNGILSNVEDHGGSGPPIVFVHGLGGSAGNWNLLAPLLADRAHCVALDLPGHGRSAPAPRCDLDAHVDAVVALIDIIDEGPVTLVGNSMGGLVSELLTARHPDLIGSLVLLSPATPPVEFTPVDRAVATRLILQSLPGLGPIITDALAARSTPEQQVQATLDVVMADPDLLPEEARLRAVELATLRRTMPWASHAFNESVRSIQRQFLRRGEWKEAIRSIGVPTTLIFGELDRVVPPSALRSLARLRPDWRTLELPDIGHTPMLERTDLVAHEVTRRLPVPA